jgi:hypothetical protein
MEGTKTTKCIETRKDYRLLIIDGINLGEKETSELRYIIEVIDNSIGNNLK